MDETLMETLEWNRDLKCDIVYQQSTASEGNAFTRMNGTHTLPVPPSIHMGNSSNAFIV